TVKAGCLSTPYVATARSELPTPPLRGPAFAFRKRGGSHPRAGRAIPGQGNQKHDTPRDAMTAHTFPTDHTPPPNPDDAGRPGLVRAIASVGLVLGLLGLALAPIGFS